MDELCGAVSALQSEGDPAAHAIANLAQVVVLVVELSGGGTEMEHELERALDRAIRLVR